MVTTAGAAQAVSLCQPREAPAGQAGERRPEARARWGREERARVEYCQLVARKARRCLALRFPATRLCFSEKPRVRSQATPGTRARAKCAKRKCKPSTAPLLSAPRKLTRAAPRRATKTVTAGMNPNVNTVETVSKMATSSVMGTTFPLIAALTSACAISMAKGWAVPAARAVQAVQGCRAMRRVPTTSAPAKCVQKDLLAENA